MSNKQGFIIIFLYCQGNIWKYRKFNGYKAGKTRHWGTKCLRHFNSPSPSFMRGIRGFFCMTGMPVIQKKPPAFCAGGFHAVRM